MAKNLFRAPSLMSRSILRLVSVSLTLVVTLFLFATGQVVQPSGSGAATSNQGSVVSPLGILTQIVPLYGIVAPDYGVPPILYGPPASAQFTVKGTIRAQNGGPIGNIHLALTDTVLKARIDSGFTAVDGTYSFTFTRIRSLDNWILSAKDIDGAAHGRFHDKDTLVTIPADSIVSGKGEKTVDLYLTQIAATVLPDPKTGANQLALHVATAANGSVEVRFHLPAQGQTWMALYGADGRLLREVFDESRSVGVHTASIPVADLAQGAYFLKLYTGDQAAIAKVFITR
jgi:hypothetical protein